MGRNPFRSSKMFQSLQSRMHANAHREQLKERLRYWLATYRFMTTSFTYAASVDAFRFSKKGLPGRASLQRRDTVLRVDGASGSSSIFSLGFHHPGQRIKQIV